jgi:hypothetical protein
MSRVVWGSESAAPVVDGMRQTLLPKRMGLVDAVGAAGQPRKRGRDGGDSASSFGKVGDASALVSDQVLWGPSGGSNRETQGRRWRPFMNGKQQQRAFEGSPYSREFVSAWQEERGTSRSYTTEFDSESLLQGFVKNGCPRNLLNGKVFFLNSCDSDPAVSVYILEKIIRFLGGSTTMAVSGGTSYVVMHHVCSSKEIKRDRAQAPAKSKTKWVHPHFILQCAKEGRLVDDKPFLVTVASPRLVQRGLTFVVDVDA